MKKRALSILLCVLLCISILPTAAFAANVRDTFFEDTLAGDLKGLGLFQGISDTDFDLDRKPSRLEALVMLIRVMGKENEALNGSWKHPFTDVAQWADKYVGYAFSSGLTQGVSDTQFGTGTASAEMYLTFVLRALGYSDTNGAGFSWNDPYVLAKSVGILPDCVNTSEFWRSDVVIVSYAALPVVLKGTTETLAQKLIRAGAFTEVQYSAYYDATAISNYGKNENEDESDKDDFNYVVYNDHVEITRYLGSDSQVSIPARIDGLPVTCIGDHAFAWCTSLTSVSIPASVTSIRDHTFDGCKSLTGVSIPDSVTSIGLEAFRGCTSLSGVSIPDSVVSIGVSAFCFCTSLTSVSIPASVTSIGGWAFDSCTSLTSVSIPASVTSIEGYAFNCCKSLNSVSIPDSVTYIGGGAFCGCASLTSVNIPDSVTSIEGYAFNCCKSLNSVSIPSSVNSIGYDAFSGCDNLTIYCPAGSYAETYARSEDIPYVTA